MQPKPPAPRGRPPGTAPLAVLAELAGAHAAHAGAEARLTAAVAAARSAGASWQTIADLLGVSKQAAHRRYSGVPKA